jgi:hypothetical protein
VEAVEVDVRVVVELVDECQLDRVAGLHHERRRHELAVIGPCGDLATADGDLPLLRRQGRSQDPVLAHELGRVFERLTPREAVAPAV